MREKNAIYFSLLLHSMPFVLFFTGVKAQTTVLHIRKVRSADQISSDQIPDCVYSA